MKYSALIAKIFHMSQWKNNLPLAELVARIPLMVSYFNTLNHPNENLKLSKQTKIIIYEKQKDLLLEREALANKFSGFVSIKFLFLFV